MRTHSKIRFYRFIGISFFLLSFQLTLSAYVPAPLPELSGMESYSEYKGTVVDKKSGTRLAFAHISIVGTNISTVTNTEGEFSLKISKESTDAKVSVSFIGYKSQQISLAQLSAENYRIALELTSVELPEINVVSKDAEALMRAVMDKRELNYFKNPLLMTAFYRETIKKNRTYVSLSEAVVEINKQAVNSYRSDIVKLYKARKNADYTKLDTISFKLQGGPFNSLYLDIMKNPEMIFTEDMFTNYEFSFDRSTHIDNRLIFILDFKQRSETKEPLYFGKLYIDAQNLALKSAVFKLNISNKEESARMFVVKKPFNARAYPYETNYRIDYLEKDGKWYYGYSRIEFGLRINWKKKLFNTNYYSTLEMAVTNWEKLTENPIDRKERLRPTVIISDEASGFSDPAFWGEYNVIEPEKSIESAIKKIQKQLEKEQENQNKQ